jgi:hypothetical protein
MSWIDSLMFTPDEDTTLGNRIHDADEAAAGRGGPTAADNLLAQQTGRNVAAQYALGQTLRQRTAAGASRQVSEGVGAANANATEMGVNLRHQEQMDAQGRSDRLHAYQDQLSQARANARNGMLFGLLTPLQAGVLGSGKGSTEAAPVAAPSETGASSAGLGDYGGGAAAGQASGAAGYGASSSAGLGLGSLADEGVSAEAESLVSDRRAKRRIKSGNRPLDTLADALHPVEFQYKDQANGSGERIGVIAQDADKGGPLGRGMVEHGPDGLRLDSGNAVGAALAGFAELHKRVEALERQRGARV